MPDYALQYLLEYNMIFKYEWNAIYMNVTWHSRRKLKTHSTFMPGIHEQAQTMWRKTILFRPLSCNWYLNIFTADIFHVVILKGTIYGLFGADWSDQDGYRSD